jgi:ligand-binding SRPBCC domain-containing protein
MPHFKQRFRVKANLAETWKLHDDPIALKFLTPPPLRVKILAKDDPLAKGGTLKFRLFLFGPLGATWHAIYDEFNPYQPGMKQCSFVDRSLSSPFAYWVHRHTFDENSDGTATVTDDVTFRLVENGPLAPILNAISYPAIVFLFAYRQFQTRRVLARAAK